MDDFSKTASSGEQEIEKMSFYSYVYNTYNKIFRKTVHDSKEYQNFFLEKLNCFPNFPDIDLISDLSCENYERNACKVKLVFLPYETLRFQRENDPMIFTYANKGLFFEKDQIRLVRKLAESVDSNHALVLCHNQNDVYNFIGIINESEIKESFSDYYFISVTNYSHWSARSKYFDLFDFKNGYFCDFDKNHKDFKAQEEDVKNYFKSCFLNVCEGSLQKIMDTINAQNHGTAFVVFNNKNKAEAEAKRLCDARRGFKPQKPLKYEDFLKCIPQFTKVDGGFLLDNNLTCYGYGCIFDGKVNRPFKGSLANGSRFNSTALYTYYLNKDLRSPVCIGVVFSDDGGVKIAKM